MLQLQEKVLLPYAGLIPPIVADYLKKEDFLARQVSAWFEPKAFESIIQNRSFSAQQRAILVQTVKEKYTQLGLIEHKTAKQQIEKLALDNCFTITTGHQLSLFGGTYFMAFKILSAIKLARELKLQFPEKEFVPILWLASEDHDFEEIKSTWWQEKFLTWELDSKEQATGNLSVETLKPVLDCLLADLEKMGGIGAHLRQWLSKAYDSAHSLAEASIVYYHHIFAEEGLIVIDANDAELKATLKPVIKKDLFTEDFYTAQLQSDRRLSERYKLQIKSRNGNFFYLHEVYGRRMLKKQKKGFALADTDLHFSFEELSQLIEGYPERFSPNVNLRPVYQELILPNLAYIGGPAEIAYWLQLKPIFEAAAVDFPMLSLRFMGLLVPEGMSKKLSKFSLGVSDVLGNEKEVVERYLKQRHPFDYAKNQEHILHSYQEIYDSIKHKDAALAKEFLNMKLAAKKALNGRKGAYKKAVKLGEEHQMERLLKIRKLLYPNGVLQERIVSYLSLQLKVGSTLNAALLSIIEPFDPGFHLLKN
jgi:bacillithiol synthase